MSRDILTPVGRLVQGDCFVPRTKDRNGNPLTIKTGPNKGQPTQQYFMAIAISKTEAETEAFKTMYAAMQAEAREGFPSLFDAAGNCIRSDFSWKMLDGDSTEMNQQNVRICDHEGFEGCFVFRFSGSRAPQVVRAGASAYITNPAELKRGYYIRIGGNVAANKNETNPGVYLNADCVELVGHGPEIVGNRPDPKAVFGGTPAVLPPGVSPVPVAPSIPTAPVAAPTMPAPPVAAPTMPAPPVAAPTMPVGVTPAPDFLTPPAPPVAAGPVTYLVEGVPYPESALTASGYTPEMIAKLPRA